MKVKDIMQINVPQARSTDEITDIASKLLANDNNLLVVCDNDKVTGVIEANNIIKQITHSADIIQLDIKSIIEPNVIYCLKEDSIERAGIIMKENAVRSLIVLNEDRSLAGIVTVKDIATKSGDEVLTNDIIGTIFKK